MKFKDLKAGDRFKIPNDDSTYTAVDFDSFGFNHCGESNAGNLFGFHPDHPVEKIPRPSRNGRKKSR